MKITNVEAAKWIAGRLGINKELMAAPVDIIKAIGLDKRITDCGSLLPIE
ncbi:MAG: hypothetical protein ACK56W_12105 [Pirellula sp.]